MGKQLFPSVHGIIRSTWSQIKDTRSDTDYEETSLAEIDPRYQPIARMACKFHSNDQWITLKHLADTIDIYLAGDLDEPQ